MKIQIRMNNSVEEVLNNYPEQVKERLLMLRQWILDVAHEESLGDVEETLKWGEPSYITKTGSTLRMDWNSKNPNVISIFVNCQTKLIETFKEVYPASFIYVGNRELQISLSSEIPEAELKHCMAMILNYHKLKHLPLLGA